MEPQDFVDSRASLRIEPKYQTILDSALAKPGRDWRTGELTRPQSYFEHVTDVYLVWRQLIDLHRSAIERVAAKAGVTADRILQSSLLCVAFHDFGKLSTNFLDMMTAKSKSEYRFAQKRNYRHEIISLPLVDYAARCLNIKQGELLTHGHLEVLAVAGHHRFLADGYLFNPERFSNHVTWQSPTVSHAVISSVMLAKAMFIQNGWNLPVGKSVQSICDLLQNENENHPYQQLRSASNSCADDDQRHKFRNVFTLLKGLLMVSDWRASSGAESPMMLNAKTACTFVPSAALGPFVKAKVEGSGKQFAGYREFQNECAAAQGHVLAIAPTGSGKTEAAFLWALNQIESGACQKVFFLLPTMVTANSLFDRAVAFFEKEHEHQVGLVHSTADLVRFDKAINEDQEDDSPSVQGGDLAERHFFYPVTIGTIDQLLNSLFHAGRWPLKTFAAMTGAIVIDEIHAYDPHTAGLVSLLLEEIGGAGGRFMVMSATMPEGLKSVVKKSLALNSDLPIHEIADSELLESARNDWQIRDIALTNWLLNEENDNNDDAPLADDGWVGEPRLSAEGLEFLRTKTSLGKRVLIVTNTVLRCQKIATAIRQYFPEAVCYHSKFIFNHRNELERRITDANSKVQILIATQVVEVSLDIGFDILLTECAPIDALIQRAGRVNRSRKLEPGKVVVFLVEENSEKIYDYPEGILDRTWKLLSKVRGLLTENQLLQLVEQVYVGYDLPNDESYKRVRNKIATQHTRLFGVLDNPRPYEEDAHLTTRLIEYPQLSVVPERFEPEFKRGDLKPSERRRYELKMPLWYVKTIDGNGDRLGYFDEETSVYFCRMGYDDFLGGIFLSAERRNVLVKEPGNEII